MIDILTTALWITLVSYVLFVIGKWIYVKFIKPIPDVFFYFISLKSNAGVWYLRIEAPEDDFELQIDISKDGKNIWTKNAHLKAGINSILLFKESELDSKNSTMLIKSSSQRLEREFIEAED